MGELGNRVRQGRRSCDVILLKPTDMKRAMKYPLHTVNFFN